MSISAGPAIPPEDILHLEEADWSRVSDRIHDDILQSLGYSLLKAELCKGLIARGAVNQAEKAIDELREQLGAVVQDLRSLMVHVRPYQEHPLGLRGTLESYLRSYPAAEGTRIAYSVDIASEPSQTVAGLLFRLVREALAEIVEHRRFEEVKVNVSVHDDRADLQVLATAPASGAAPARGGGRDLGWRVRLIGGESHVRDSKDCLEWSFHLPISNVSA